MSAEFLVEGVFEITGRGLVIAGQILDGTLRVGSRIALRDASGGIRLELVTGVEMGHSPDGPGGVRDFVGLVVGQLPKSERSDLRRRLSAGTKLSVKDPE